MGLWTPAYLTSCVGWFDASDASTITDDGTGKASQWNDKSSNANHLTPSTATHPTINVSGINGLGTLTFTTASSMQKQGASGLPSNTTGIGLAAVLLPSSFASLEAGISLGDHANVNTESALIYTGSGGGGRLRTRANNALQATIAFTDTTNPHVWSGTCSLSLRDLYIDGTAGTSQGTTTTNGASPDILIGGQLAAGTNGIPGKYGEIVVFSGTSTSDRQILEGYLAWKWGVQANLPGGHPYASAAPTVSDPVGLIGLGEAEY